MCNVVRNFATVLSGAGAVSRTPTSVYLFDERFSSVQAEAMLHRHGGRLSKKVEIDSLAASLILDHYFAERGEGRERVEPGEPTSELRMAAGVTAEEEGCGSKELFGEDLKLQRDKERAESLRLVAEREYVPFMRAPKSKRKRRKR